MNIINNHDLNFGGIAAVNRAINALAAHVNDLRNQQELLEIANAQLAQRIARLELARRPASEPMIGSPAMSGGTIADSWLPASESWVIAYAAAEERKS